MNSTARILALLAGLGCLVLAVLYGLGVRENRSLAAQLESARGETRRYLAELAAGDREREKLQTQLVALDADLGATKTRLTEAEAAKVQLTRELAANRTELREMTAEQARLRAEIARLQNESGHGSPEIVAAHEATIARLEAELARLQQAPAPAGPVLSTNRARSTMVVSVGPSDAFVVINYGASHGALPAQKMLIKRGTETVGTALISDVREQYSVAQVDPGSLRGALHKGDSAVLAH